MGIINVLDRSVANLIAAGEVVERPASAVKEMAENSIDAGATEITAEIKNGGLSFLRISDNGIGMSGEDAMMCIRPHATSKIRTASDLSSIMTLGFRGEALAAISAVTDMRIMTAERNASSGTLVTCSYGRLVDVAQTGCPTGTTIICESMFAHTPARLKFMKSNTSETAYVASVMERLAISRPDIAFKFIADGTLRFSTRGDGNLKNAIYSVFGAFATKMCKVDYSNSGIGVSGFVSSPDNVRGNRAMQNFFINSRAVKNKTLTAALEQAYRSYIPSDKFPSCVINISINSSLVDVNIHPSKLEVKFTDDRAVFNAVYYAVRGVMENSLERPTLDNLRSDSTGTKKSSVTEEKLKVVSAFVPTEKTEKFERTNIFENYAREKEKDKNPLPRVNIDIDSESDCNGESGRKNYDEGAEYFALAGKPSLHSSSKFPDEKEFLSVFPEIENIEKTEKMPPTDVSIRTTEANGEITEPIFSEIPAMDAGIEKAETKEIPEYTIIGELYSTYVIMQLSDKVILVDKHAAHERINFEILRAGIRGLKPNVQLLISPEEIVLSSEEASFASEFQKEISDCGFLFEIKNEKNVYLSGIPAGFELSAASDMFISLISGLAENHENIEFRKTNIFERALYQTACKASVKGGIVYDEAHLRYICDNLLRYDCIKYCPHGRPVAFEISKRELDRRFGRIK